MKKTRTKKILTVILLVVLLVCFLSDIPQSLLNMLSYSTEAETDTTGITVIIKADYSSASEIVLTAVFKNDKNETVDAEDVSDDISYTWYKSTSSYEATPFDDEHKTETEITYENVTASASSSDNDEETASTSDNDADESETESEEETETESEEEASAEETEAQAKAVDKNANSIFGLTGVLEAEAADEGSNSITVETGYVYYVSVTVGGAGGTVLTAAPKYVSTDIAGVKIQNDIYRDGVLTALLVNSEGDALYYDYNADRTTYNSSATYTWYCQQATNTYVYTDEAAPDNADVNYVDITTSTDKGTASTNKLTPAMGTIYYYYYVKVSFEENGAIYTYSSDPRIADIYTGITVEIEQVKAQNSNDITLNMVVYDDNGDVMYENDGTTYYYNSSYTTTWYKSKEYFASTGDGTTADDESKVTTTATEPLGYAPQDYYGESNYMRVSNAVYNASTNTYGYTNSITVSDDNGGEVGRYYYVDINKKKTNGSAEAGADPVFVRNCTSTVVIEDDIATDGTFKAVVYNANGERVDSTTADGYTYTWYKTVSGTSTYTNDKDVEKTSDAGRFISSYDTKTGSLNGAYYSDSGRFSRNTNATTKTSEYGGISMDKDTQSSYYDEVRDNLSEEIADVSDVFGSANYSFDTSGNGDTFALNDGVVAGTSLNDGSSCNVATDEGQLRYYYVEVVIDANTTYTSVVKYVKYSNQIENGGFQDSGNSTRYDASLTTYWQTTNKGYTENYNTANASNEQYYLLHPMLELATYTSSNAYGTYGNYYSYPGLSYDKVDIETQTDNDTYLRLDYDDDCTTDYVFDANQFCEINSTDNNTLYQTVMTVPGMPLYWSLTHHARTSSNVSTTITDVVVYQNENGGDVTVEDLGATKATVMVSIDIMYVVIMDETDAESLLANGDTLEEQQSIINEMILSITGSNAADVIQSSEDGICYLARYDEDSYSYKNATYENISVWRVQTGSTKVQVEFSSANATDAAAAANNKELFEYYAEKYGTVKSYSYTSGSYSYATFYTESQTYADEYEIPTGQYLSRYFFVAGSSVNTRDANGNNAYTGTSTLSFGTYTDDNGEEHTIESYNDVKRATNSNSAGNFIDNVRFMQQLEVEVNYWVYDADEDKYVLQSADTETSNTYQDRTVTADADTVAEYYSKYKFVGSYVSADGGDENTPNEEELGSVTLFKADTDSALVLDLYYTPYDLEFKKEITGLPATMSYADFKKAMTITIYKLTYDETNKTYKMGDETSIDNTYLVYNSTDETLTLSTDYIFEKGYYLITETTEILITDEFDGWFSVDMSVEIGGLEYNDDLRGFILHVDEDENGVDLDSYTSSDGKMEISVVNTYKPVAVDCTKSVVFGSTDLTAINTALTGTADYDGITSLNYASLTECDEENEVDDTDISSDGERRAVLSGDTLTYRMELTSTKNATGITVKDTVPDGCTLVEGSIKILYQKREEVSGSHYGIVSEKLSTGDVNVTGTTSGTTTTWTVYDTADPPNKLYEITYDSSKCEITWWISKMGFYEQYYVEFEVTVDQISASTEKELLTNSAEYKYQSEFINTTGTSSVGMSMSTQDGTNSTVEYTVEFSNLSGCNVTWLKDTLPDDFTIDAASIKVNNTELSTAGYTVTYYDSDGKELTDPYAASDIRSFVITPDGTNASSISTGNDEKITLIFSGTSTTTAAAGTATNSRNAAGIKFKESGGSTEYYAVVLYGEGVTNRVETDVTHLYFEIEKVISEKDPAQTFLFQVAYTPEGGTDTEYSYVTINCTNEVTDNGTTIYTGSTIVQSDVRGTYTITEVTDWSNTDYDFSSAAYTNLTEIDDTTLNEITTSTDSNNVTSVTLTLPGLYFTSNTSTFPTALGSLETGTYATAIFTDTASLYAYLSDQAYSYNVMQEMQ